MKGKKRIKVWALIATFCFIVGILLGILLGIMMAAHVFFNGLGVALQGSQLNITVDVNESQMVDAVYKHLDPFINETLTQLKNCELNSSAEGCQ